MFPLPNPAAPPIAADFPHRWDAQAILDACEQHLRDHNSALDQEQATTGLDALDEVQVHPLLASALKAAGLGVLREHPLPGPDGQLIDPKRLPKHSQRERCDLVLLPTNRHALIDWVREQKDRSCWQESLFQTLAMPPPLPDASLCVNAWDAFWLEVKVVAQHAFVDGVPRPNAAWSSQLVSSLTHDLAKLAAHHHHDAARPGSSLPNAALLLVVFAETPELIAHDLPIAFHRALDKAVAFRSPLHASRRDASSPPGFAIADRIGNAWCQCILVPAC